MCKISINNMLWLKLMSAVQNYHLPMLERWRYAVRHSQHLCKFVSGIIPQHLPQRIDVCRTELSSSNA